MSARNSKNGKRLPILLALLGICIAAYAADQVLDDRICGNCGDPNLDQRRYTLDALNWCMAGLNPLNGWQGSTFLLTHDSSSPCNQWAAYNAWRPTDDKLFYTLAGASGHNGHSGPNADKVAVIVNYSTECLVEVDIPNFSGCPGTDAETIMVTTIAPNGNVDTVEYPVHDDGRFIGPLPQTNHANVPYACDSRPDIPCNPAPPPVDPEPEPACTGSPANCHPPHSGQSGHHWYSACWNPWWSFY